MTNNSLDWMGPYEKPIRSESKLMPAGLYVIRIMSSKMASDDKGREYWVIQGKVLTSEFKGNNIFDKLWSFGVSDKGLQMAKHKGNCLREACNMPDATKTTEFEGALIVIKNSHNTYESNGQPVTVNQINDYFPLSKFPALKEEMEKAPKEVLDDDIPF